MTDSTDALRSVTRRLIEMEGAAAEEIEPAGLEFVAPPALQESLGIPEHGRLGFRPDLPDGAQRVTFESDWLERLERALGERGRRARRVIEVPRPTLSDPVRTLEHGLVLKNAVYRLLRVEPAWTRYLVIGFHYAALSDEKRDGIVQLAINLSTSSTPDAATTPLLEAANEVARAEGDRLFPGGESPSRIERLPVGVALPRLWSAEQIFKVVSRAVPSRIRNHLSPFLRGMTRRLDRDLARVCEYYNDLHRESSLRARKRAAVASKASSPLQLEEDVQSAIDLSRIEASAIEAVSREYESKVADLQQKYAMKVDVRLIQILDVITPVQRFELLLKRRKRERRFNLDWNPVSKLLEPPPCEYSYTADPVRLVCDDALHLISPDSHRPCPNCNREYCRACTGGRCSKCSH